MVLNPGDTVLIKVRKSRPKNSTRRGISHEIHISFRLPQGIKQDKDSLGHDTVWNDP